MNKSFFTLALGLLMGFSAIAQDYTKDQCKSNAMSFATQQMGIKNPQLTAVMLGHNHIYGYNISSGGFIIVSIDSRTLPVLGYSTKGQLEANHLAPATEYWLKEYESQIARLGNTTLDELYAAYPGDAKPPYADSVAPLITSTWSQYGYGYNSLVPADTTYALDSNMVRFQEHPTVGCGALAAAQIMRYWQFPQHGNGSHCYTQADQPCWHYGTVCADFASTTYNYALMPDRLTDTSTAAEIDAVATLLFHCGVSCNMNYNADCAGSSGSTISSNLFGLQSFFHYDNNASYFMRNSYSLTTWTNMLKNDLSNGRPIYYCGQSFRNDEEGTQAGGHAFVCDGYDANDYFHFNWGWGGYCDGYYSLSVLRPMTAYDFTYYQYCILGLQPSYHAQPVMVQGSDLVMHRINYHQGDSISGSYSITNIGDTLLNTYVGVNIYGNDDREYYGCVDGRQVILQPGDTLWCEFSYPLDLPVGTYMALMQYHTEPMYAGNPLDESMYFDDGEHVNNPIFNVTDSSVQQYTNLVLFVRFADDPDFSTSYQDIRELFQNPSNSVYDFFDKISYGKIHYNSVFPSNSAAANQVIPYVDIHNRGYYQPWSPSNPEGYTTPNPMVSISQREAELLARVCRYADSLGLVSPNAELDGDYDGDIDNISFVVQGSTGNWAELLWPHMEFFPHDSIGYNLTINGKLVNCFNFEFEGSPAYFSLRTFTHEIGHSLQLPDLYHYYVATDVYPVYYDNMAVVNCHPSAIYKHNVLHVSSAPIEITQPGTYTISSLGSSPDNNLYYIRSQIDTNQWYTIEYRNNQDSYEDRLHTSGLIIGRWMDTVTRNIYFDGNSEFNGTTEPNTYWQFRPNSDSDLQGGDHRNTIFNSESNTPSEFGPGTNPHPYLADGTPESFFRIYDIQPNGQTCTFQVDLTPAQGIEMAENSIISIYPNPAASSVMLQGIQAGTPIKIYNMMGQPQLATTYNGSNLDITTLSAGIYILSTPSTSTKLIKTN